MKNRFFISVFFVLFATIFLNAQTQEQIEQINRTLDSVPYFEIRDLDYSVQYNLPDSTKAKIVKALNRELSKSFWDEILTYPDDMIERIKDYAWRQCKNDTTCFEKVYAERYAINVESDKRNFSNRCISSNLILACGSWEITEAIPYLEKELKNEKCTQFGKKEIIEMTLAKLGVDSVKQVLLERYTLPHFLSAPIVLYDTVTMKNPVDTINDNNNDSYGLTIDLLQEGLRVAMYLENKEIILNLLDLLYVRGRHNNGVSIEPIVVSVVRCFKEDFRKFPNYEILDKIYNNASDIRRLDNRKLNKKEQQELERLLSTEYRTKIKEQLREWVIENVNFE